MWLSYHHKRETSWSVIASSLLERHSCSCPNWKHLFAASNRLSSIITTQCVFNELMVSCHFSVFWWLLSFGEGCCQKVTFTELPTFVKTWTVSSTARVQLRKWCMKWGPLIILPWMKHKEKAFFRDADMLASVFPLSALEVASIAGGRRIISYNLHSTPQPRSSHLHLCMSVRGWQKKTPTWFHLPAKAFVRTTAICI